MLFDLRSRNRRAAVKVIYLSLAVIMVVGLVGLGIGTGSTGGLLNAGGNGSGGNSQSANTAQVKAAMAAVKKDPSSANWAKLMGAHYAAASATANSTTGAYTKAGLAELGKAAAAWQEYLTATNNKPSQENAVLAAHIYQSLSQWSDETNAWNYYAQTAAGADRLKSYFCLALSAYAAKQTSKGDLAAAVAIPLVPKADRLTQQAALKEAKTSASQAQTALVENC